MSHTFAGILFAMSLIVAAGATAARADDGDDGDDDEARGRERPTRDSWQRPRNATCVQDGGFGLAIGGPFENAFLRRYADRCNHQTAQESKRGNRCRCAFDTSMT